MSNLNPTEATIKVLSDLHRISSADLESLLNRKMPVPAGDSPVTHDLIRNSNRDGHTHITVLGLLNSVLELSGNSRVVRVTEDGSVLGYVAHPSRPAQPVAAPNATP